jgi:siroheme synthase-like protein
MHYPLFFNLKGRPVVVVGGGKVAERKITLLLRAGAAITIVSPSLTPRLARWEAEKRITALRRPYRRGDLDRAALAFAATDQPSVNETVAREGRQKRIPFNLADRADSDGFIVPAVFSKGGITIAVSSGGKSPVLAKQVRDYLKACWTGTDQRWVEVLARIKRALVQKKLPLKKRGEILRRLVESDVSTLYRKGQIQAAHALILKLSGLRRADLASPSAATQKGVR